MMHTELDTETVTRTLARYGVQHHSPAYYRTRAIVRHVVASLAVVATFALAGFAGMITR